MIVGVVTHGPLIVSPIGIAGCSFAALPAILVATETTENSATDSSQSREDQVANDCTTSSADECVYSATLLSLDTRAIAVFMFVPSLATS